MTLYVDKEYYLNEYHGTIPESEVEKYLKKSQEKIDSITCNRIVRIGFDNLTSFQQEKIKEAICIQADYINEHGYNDKDDNDISSYSVLDISVSVKDDSSKNTMAKRLHVDEEAYDLVHKTGLDDRIL